MSSSTSPSPTSTSPSPTHSHSRAAESGIQIPTTTVVGIGAGFVGFALSLLGTLLLIRFIRLALRARREGIPVRTAWVDQGGFFGWIHGVGARDSETDRLRRMDELERSGYWGGGGGWYTSEITRMRLWNELRRENALAMARASKGEELGDRPGMWEVDLNPGEKAAFDTEVDLDLVQYTPMSIGTRPPLKDTITPKPPTIHLSLLIALPAPEAPTRSRTDIVEEGDLPDLVIGTASLIPTISRHQPSQEEDEEDEKGSVLHLERISSPMDEKQSSKNVEVAHLEYGPGRRHDLSVGSGMQRAGWVKRKVDKEEKWVIEGLENCMSGTSQDTS